MADIVLGVATSHTPQISVSWEHWPDLNKTDTVGPAVPADLEERLKPEVHKRQHRAAQEAIRKLSQVLQGTKDLDAIIIFGDDQHEQFLDENLPALAVYHGDVVPIVQRVPRPNTPSWAAFESAGWEHTRPEYPGCSSLGTHLIESLTEQEFEVARCSQLRVYTSLPLLRYSVSRNSRSRAAASCERARASAMPSASSTAGCGQTARCPSCRS